MPTYQYACTACDHRLEAVQSFSDDPLTECPACEGRLRKLYSAVGIVFKGSGFYRTDSRASGDATKSPSGDNGAKKDSGSSGSGSSDSATTTSSSPTSSSSTGSSSTGSSSTASSTATPAAKS